MEGARRSVFPSIQVERARLLKEREDSEDLLEPEAENKRRELSSVLQSGSEEGSCLRLIDVCITQL